MDAKDIQLELYAQRLAQAIHEQIRLTAELHIAQNRIAELEEGDA